MVRIQFVDHPRDVIDGIVDGRVRVVVIELVADQPRQHRGMIAILEHLPTDQFELRSYRVGIVIVEAMTLGSHRQADCDRYAMLVRSVEQRHRVLLVIERGPGANRVTAMTRKPGDIVPPHAGAANLVRLAAAQELITGLGTDNFNLCW